MRKIFMLGVYACLLSCATNKVTPTGNSKITITSGCKAGVTCTGVIHDKKRMEVEVNDDGTLQYRLVEDKSTMVFILAYDRDLPKNVQDGQYREEFIFEIPDQTMPVQIKLDRSSKAVFGRFCYCKGTTGYYPVEGGQVRLEMQKGQRTGHVSFQVTAVPQIWKEASFLIQ